MTSTEALRAAIAKRPERPHRHDSTETIKAALARNNADTRRLSQAGRKQDEEMCHAITNEFLDELEYRGAL